MSAILNSVKDLFHTGMYNKADAVNVFDWEQAASEIVKHRPHVAYTAMKDHVNATKTMIYRNGEALFPAYCTYCSFTDIPVLILDNKKPIPCYKKEYERGMFEGWTLPAMDILKTVLRS